MGAARITSNETHRHMSERRYTDTETAAIFKAAAELQQAALTRPEGDPGLPGSSDGMTLAQLQEVGREVGIPSELVARAASGLDRRGRASVRRFLGLPIGVGRTVPLQRNLTEDEWERLVVDLRETFDARGRLHTDGQLRQWTNGNLQALLEPTRSGHQLRLKTIKGDAYALMAVGATMIAWGGFLFTLLRLVGRAHHPAGVLFFSVIGVAMAMLGALRVPGWAKRRRQQMEEIATRLTESTAG